MLQAGRSRDRIPVRWIFFNFPNPSSRTMALGSTKPLTEMSTGIFRGVNGGRRVRLTNLRADCLENVRTCYRDTFTSTFIYSPGAVAT
jgi:hypothetical protein